MKRMKKSVGLVTIYDNYNIGNRLQNYAGEQILSEYFKNVCTLTLAPAPYAAMEEKKYIFHKATGFRFCRSKEYWQKEFAKKRLFTQFNNEHLHVVRLNSVKEANSAADVFAVGSDQVWNPVWLEDEPEKRSLYQLAFADPDKRICLSPSIGLSEFPEKWSAEYTEQFMKYKMLGCREQEGADLLEKMTGKPAVCTIDPTLMLSASDWRKISKKPVWFKKQDKPLLLSFFIGGMSKRASADCSAVADKYGFSVLNMPSPYEETYHITGPAEFIWLIDHADMIITDSFHASVFSFLMNKPFLAYPRNDDMPDMSSRFLTLFEITGTTDRFITDKLPADPAEADYSGAEKRLQLKQKEFKEFLEKSI